MNRRELGLREFGRVTDGRGPVATGVVREASPVLAEGVERFIFADVFSRSGLGARERELLTVAVLSAIGGADNQLGVHVPAALNAGADPEELLQLCEQIVPYCGFPRALNALRAVRAVLTDRGLPLPPEVVEVPVSDHVTLAAVAGEAGDGDLLLHAPELDRRVWRDLMRAMPGRRVVAPDLRGAGAAVGAPPPDGLDGLVDDARRVADATGLGRVRIITLGTAAVLGVALAEAIPDRVTGLVMVSPALPQADASAPVTADLVSMLLPRTLATDPWGARYARDRLARIDREGWSAVNAALAAATVWVAACPTRVVDGDHDAAVSPVAATHAWGVETVEHVPGAARLAPLEAPAALAELLGGGTA